MHPRKIRFFDFKRTVALVVNFSSFTRMKGSLFFNVIASNVNNQLTDARGVIGAWYQARATLARVTADRINAIASVTYSRRLLTFVYIGAATAIWHKCMSNPVIKIRDKNRISKKKETTNKKMSISQCIYRVRVLFKRKSLRKPF